MPSDQRAYNGSSQPAPVPPEPRGPTAAAPRPVLRSWDDLWLTTQVLEHLAPCATLADLLSAVVEPARALFPHDAGLVAVMTAARPAQVRVVTAYDLPGAPPTGTLLPLARLVRAWEPADGRLRTATGAASGAARAPLFATAGLADLLAIPLTAGAGGPPVAVLLLGAMGAAAFDEIPAAHIAAFQRAVALPLGAVWAREPAAPAGAARMEPLAQVFAVVAAPGEATGGLHRLLADALAGTGAAAGSLMAVDPDGAGLYVRASAGLPPNIGAGDQLPWGSASAAPVAALTAPLRVHPLAPPGGPAAIPWAAAAGLATYLGVPLHVGPDAPVSGLLNLYWRPGAPAPAGPDADLARLAQAAAWLLEHAALHERCATSDRVVQQFQAQQGVTLPLMAHQLRTPITAIQGFAQLLLRRAPDADGPIARYGTTILNECRRLRVVIDNTMALAHIEGETVTVDVRPFDLAALLRDLERQAPASAPGAWLVPAVLPLVLGDPARLEQVLLALLRSAAAERPAAGPRVRVQWNECAGMLPAAVDVVVELGMPGPDAAGIDELLGAIDLRAAIDNPEARDTDLALYAAWQLLRAMGATARRATDAAGSRYILTLPVLDVMPAGREERK